MHPTPRRTIGTLAVAALAFGTTVLPCQAKPTPVDLAAAPPAAGTGLPAVASLDGNASTDLVVLDRTGRALAVYLGTGSGLPAAPSSRIPLPAMPRSVVLGNFDDGGTTDVAVLARGQVVVLFGNGDGTFSTPTSIAVPTDAAALVAGALRGAGLPHDLVVLRVGEEGELLLFEANGDRTFAASTVALSPMSRQGSLTIADVGTSSTSPTRDGNLDIVVHSRPVLHTRVSVPIRFGDGNGGITGNGFQDVFLMSNPVGITALDHDGDGCSDLALIGPDWTKRPATLLVLRGLCNGSPSGVGFTGEGSLAQPRTAFTDVVAVALDATPGVDLALTDDRNDAVRLVGQAFTSVPCAVGKRPAAVAAGDFDGDGDADLAVANLRSRNVSLLLLDGTLTCGARVDLGL